MKKYKSVKTLITLLIGISGQAQAEDWVFQISPYLYMPNVTNDIKTPYTPAMSLERPFSEVYSALDDALFIQALARKDNWVTLADLNYSKLSQEGHVTLPFVGRQHATGEIKYTSLSLMTGYRFIPEQYQQLSFDLLGGLRYWSFKNQLSLSSYQASFSKQWVEPVIAGRLRYSITKDLSFIGYIDRDMSLDNQSWQWSALVNYDLTKSTSLSAGYKAQRIHPVLSKESIVSKSEGILVGFSYRF